MKHPRPTILAPLALSALLLGNVPAALAGTATISSGDGSEATFEYNDTMLRIGSAGNDEGYALLRDGKLYTVALNNGQPMVIDAGSMMQGMSAMNIAPAQLSSDLNGEMVSFKDTGKDETVAGIRGDVWEVRFKDEEGKEQSETLVLSDDKRVREFNDALFRMINIAANFASEKAVDQGKDFLKRLEDLDAGVLRYGQEMRVSSISDDAIAASRFELPAEPMNLEGLGAMLGSFSAAAAKAAEESDGSDADEPAQEKGGLFSSMMGALGGKAERQGDRVSEEVDQKVDEETDEAVDKALGKAFGKLFGNN